MRARAQRARLADHDHAVRAARRHAGRAQRRARRALSHVPDEVKKYALGYYGKLLAPVDPDVLDRIVANGSPTIASTPRPLSQPSRKLRKKYPNIERRRAAAALMYAGRQVDEMLAAGPTCIDYQFERPMVRLVRELRRRAKSRESCADIEKPEHRPPRRARPQMATPSTEGSVEPYKDSQPSWPEPAHVAAGRT